MLGCLGVRGSVAGAEVGTNDDVRDRGVGKWVAETLRDEIGAGDGVVDFQGRFLRIEVCDSGCGVGGVVEPD